MPKERHPFWNGLPREKIETLLGECGEAVVTKVDVVAEEKTLELPTILVGVDCLKYPNGETLHEPFAVFDELDREERAPLVLKTARVKLCLLCEGCEFRLDKNQ